MLSFLKKKKSGRGSDIVLKRQYQVFLTVIILVPIRICSIFYVVRKYFFFFWSSFHLRGGVFVLIKRENWKRKLEQMDPSYQATLCLPGNGKWIGASAKWIFFPVFKKKIVIIVSWCMNFSLTDCWQTS